jgi:hypothetical protein
LHAAAEAQGQLDRGALIPPCIDDGGGTISSEDLHGEPQELKGSWIMVPIAVGLSAFLFGIEVFSSRAPTPHLDGEVLNAAVHVSPFRTPI